MAATAPWSGELAISGMSLEPSLPLEGLAYMLGWSEDMHRTGKAQVQFDILTLQTLIWG